MAESATRPESATQPANTGSPATPRVVDLTPAEVDLIRTAVHMLLQIEDDPETIRDLKRLMARFESEG